MEKPDSGNESSYTVAGIGELLWDELPSGRVIGGAPANFVYHCAALGARAHIVSAVGGDEAGRDITAALELRGIDTTHVSRDDNHPTGTVAVSLSDKGVPQYTISEDVAWDHIPSTAASLSLAASAEAVCFGSLAQRSTVSRETIRAFLTRTKPVCLRLFDLNLRQHFYSRDEIEASLRLANMLKLNEDELTRLAEMFGLGGDAETVMDSLAGSYSLRVVALTRGERGCIIRTIEESASHEGFPQGHISDTVGAGDCFSAVLTMGVLRNEPLEQIAAEANRRAAYVCTKQGAMPQMP